MRFFSSVSDGGDSERDCECELFESEELDPEKLAREIAEDCWPTITEKLTVHSEEDRQIGGIYRIEIGMLSITEIEYGKEEK